MPYRDAEILLPCPRCAASLAREPRGHAARCLDGCGDFIAAAGLPELFGEELAFARPSQMWWKASATACPSCKGAMRVLELGDARFYRCAEHGAWFDNNASPLAETIARARQHAAQLARAAKAELERVAEGSLIDRDEDQAPELARRLLEAEATIARLREEIATLRKRLGEAP